MNRSVVDRAAIEAEVARRRASKQPTPQQEPRTSYGSWVAAKVFVIPTAMAGLFARMLHRPVEPPAVPSRPMRRRAGVYVWRPTFGPDGMPDSDGEIVPLEEASRARPRRTIT